MQSETECKPNGTWQPRISAFVCKWCTYAGADLAGTSRLKYPPQIRIVKLPCSGRIDPLFLLRAFQMGADGVLVSGCHPGDCHYISGNYFARRRWVMFRELLEFVGFDMRRLHFSWVSAAEGAKFVDVVKRVTDAVREAGPFPGFAPTGVPARPIRGAAPPRPEAVAPEIDAMREDLASGKVTAVLGYRGGRVEGSLRPSWAREASDLARLRHAEGATPSLVTYLVRMLKEDPRGKYGVIAGHAELEAIELLRAESQIDPDRVVIYPQPTAPRAADGREAWELYPVPSMESPLPERWDFWTAEFARCLRCNACRQGCPLCSCSRCIADKSRPRWIDASPRPEGNWVWNVTRAFHRAGHCADCGGCTAACPAGIPLGALTHHLGRAAVRHFGAPAEGAAQRSPLAAYRLEDEASFIL
jgi:coenzyme F420-reducing hydrogenase delta subunit/ferredoxin